MIKQFWRLLFYTTLLCLNLQGYDYEYVQEPDVVHPCYYEKCSLSPCKGWDAPFRLTISHTEGKWYDVEMGYTSFDAFLAFVEDHKGSIIPFIDLRQHVFNDGKLAANAGGGVRFAVDKSSNIFGANLYYDYRRSKWGSHFHQLGIGFEFLSPCVDFRLNFYLPLGKTNENSRLNVYDQYIGPWWATCQEHRNAITGGDLELGTWLVPRRECRFVNLYAAITPYYYSSRHNHHDRVYGIIGRFETLLGEYFSLELKGGYDRSYKGMVQGTLCFQMPLDQLFHWESWCGKCCRWDCRAYQPVVRQELIVLDPKQCCWKSNF